jgi:hypothetical protein
MANAEDAEGYITRGVIFTLDPSPAQERLLRSYCGAARVAHNWSIHRARTNRHFALNWGVHVGQGFPPPEPWRGLAANALPVFAMVTCA